MKQSRQPLLCKVKRLSDALVQSLSRVWLSWPYGVQSTRILCPWDFPGENTWVGCHFLLQGIFLDQGLHLCLLHFRQSRYRWATREAPKSSNYRKKKKKQTQWAYDLCSWLMEAGFSQCGPRAPPPPPFFHCTTALAPWAGMLPQTKTTRWQPCPPMGLRILFFISPSHKGLVSWLRGPVF